MVSDWRARMGSIGIWSAELRFGDQGRAHAAAAELDRLGYGALWVPGGVGGDILETMDRLVSATEPAEVGAWWAGESAGRRERLMLGLGVSHGPLIGEQYAKPIAVMRAYIGALNAAGVDRDHLCVAAFGPKMLALSRDLTAGAHPYLVTPEHTAEARALLGPEALLAPGQAVALETDPARARQIARGALSVYLEAPGLHRRGRRDGQRPAVRRPGGLGRHRSDRAAGAGAPGRGRGPCLRQGGARGAGRRCVRASRFLARPGRRALLTGGGPDDRHPIADRFNLDLRQGEHGCGRRAGRPGRGAAGGLKERGGLGRVLRGPAHGRPQDAG
jgi:probable F420-dependent oxidoreductase